MSNFKMEGGRLRPRPPFRCQCLRRKQFMCKIRMKRVLRLKHFKLHNVVSAILQRHRNEQSFHRGPPPNSGTRHRGEGLCFALLETFAKISERTHSRSQGGQRPCPPKFLAYLVVLCFERRCPKPNTVARSK